jgi:hypothetical protein
VVGPAQLSNTASVARWSPWESSRAERRVLVHPNEGLSRPSFAAWSRVSGAGLPVGFESKELHLVTLACPPRGFHGVHHGHVAQRRSVGFESKGLHLVTLACPPRGFHGVHHGHVAQRRSVGFESKGLHLVTLACPPRGFHGVHHGHVAQRRSRGSPPRCTGPHGGPPPATHPFPH